MSTPKNWDADDWAAFERHVGDAPLNVGIGGPDKAFDGRPIRWALKTLLERTRSKS